MAKAAAQESADTRILRIAIEHIRRFGLRKTTVVGIAEDAGMSHANVYRHYPSKQALIDAITSHWLRPMETGLRDIADGPDPSHDKLERIVMAIFRIYRDRLDDDPAIFELFVEAANEGRGVARRHRGLLQTILQRVIDDGMASEAFMPGDQRWALALVFDSLHRFIYPASVALDREVTRPHMNGRLERVLKVVINALRRGQK